MKHILILLWLFVVTTGALIATPQLDFASYSNSPNYYYNVFGDTVVTASSSKYNQFRVVNGDVEFDSSLFLPGTIISKTVINEEYIYSMCDSRFDTTLKKIQRGTSQYAVVVDSMDVQCSMLSDSETYLLVNNVPAGVAVIHKETFEIVAQYYYPEVYTELMSDSLFYCRNQNNVLFYDARDIQNPVVCDSIPMELPNTLIRKPNGLYWSSGDRFGVYTFPDGFHKELVFSGSYSDHGSNIDVFWNDEYCIIKGTGLTTLWDISTGSAELLFTMDTPYEHQVSRLIPVYDDCFMMCGFTGDCSLLKRQNNELIIENLSIFYNRGTSLIADDDGDLYMALQRENNSGVLHYSFDDAFEMTNYFPNNTQSDKRLTRSEHYAAYGGTGSLKVYPSDHVMENCILTIPGGDIGFMYDTGNDLYVLWSDEYWHPYLDRYSVENGDITLQTRIEPDVGYTIPVKIMPIGNYILCYFYTGHVAIYDTSLNVVSQTVLSQYNRVKDHLVAVRGDYVYFVFTNHVKIYYFDGTSLQYHSSYVPQDTYFQSVWTVGNKLIFGCNYELRICDQDENTGSLSVIDILPLAGTPVHFVCDSDRNIVYIDDTVTLYAYEYDFSICAADPQLAPLPAVSLSNYPNPFNPSTEIRFQLSDASQLEHTQIEIFNTKGQKVKELNADMSSRPSEAHGEILHSVTWDGTDSTNQPVSSGVYLYQLRAGKQTLAQKKMMLLK
jgi:hypothetical protein